MLADGLTAGACRRPRHLQDELALGRLEVVVVPELPAADEFPERGLRLHAVDSQLAFQEFVVAWGELGLDAVDSESGRTRLKLIDGTAYVLGEPRRLSS